MMEPKTKARLRTLLSARPRLMMPLLTGSMRISTTEAIVGLACTMRPKKRFLPKRSVSHSRPPQRAARKATKEPSRLPSVDHSSPCQKPKANPASAQNSRRGTPTMIRKPLSSTK